LCPASSHRRMRFESNQELKSDFLLLNFSFSSPVNNNYLLSTCLPPCPPITRFTNVGNTCDVLVYPRNRNRGANKPFLLSIASSLPRLHSRWANYCMLDLWCPFGGLGVHLGPELLCGLGGNCPFLVMHDDDALSAHVVPPPAIAEEEDDSGGAGGFLSAAARSGLARRRQTRMPPPIQYDPTTNTTTLTKKVFAGYQQFITTKSPEGKTRSHTKLVYDPSVDVEEEDEPEPEPEPVQVAVVAPPARTRKTEDVVDSVPMRVARKATAVAFPNPKPAPTATPPQSQTTSTLPTNESPRSPIVPKKASPPAVTPPVQQQQVAQETLAGKPSASIEPTQPVKTVRKKRHISSLPLRPSSTATPAPTSTISADGAQSSSPSASASSRTPPPASLRKPRQPAKARVVSSSGSPDLTATPSTTKAELPLHSSSPAAHTRTTSGGKQETMTPTRTTNATQPPSSSPSSILTLRNPSSSSFRGVGLKQHDEANSVVSAAAVDDAKMTPAVPSSPPVPPRRKRESKMARLARLIRSFCTIL
uniref:Uncharacterized protein n=1 Tax=Anopheles atroparvus TaxID=41427 RepID=A0A182J6M2_ANOAO